MNKQNKQVQKPQPKPTQQHNNQAKPTQQKPQTQANQPQKAAHQTNPKTNANQQKPQQKVQQQQQQQQIAQEQQLQAPPKLQITNKIKLPSLMTTVDTDKQSKKISFIIDKTGNAYTFFKYKGTIIDVSDMVVFETTKGKSHEENKEQARKSIVYSLNVGDNLVISTDVASTDLNEFFKSGWWLPEQIFNYEEIVKPKYFREHLLKPEEDQDGFGNKGNFYPKETLHIILLVSLKEGEIDPQTHLQKLGLDKLSNQFNITSIED